MSRHRKTWITAILLLCLSLLLPVSESPARIVIDIIKAPRRLPIAILDFTGPNGRAISSILRTDLTLSGLFVPLNNAAFIEQPNQAFRRLNWTPLGAEAVIKGSVQQMGDRITVTVTLYDVFEGRAVLTRNYEGKRDQLRPLAHTVSNDIYEKITNLKGVFKTRIAFVSKDGDRQKLHLMDWDGKRLTDLGISAAILLTPHWTHDAKKLLYSAQKGKSWKIMLLDLRTLREKVVFSSEGTNIAGDFFPGSEEFTLSSSGSGTPDIFVHNIPKSRTTRLTKDRGIEVSPAVSPDGKTIAYVSDRGGSPQIYTMDRIGYNRARITFETNYSTTPVWSPRGDKLAFTGSYKGKHQIFVVGPDGSGLEMLTRIGNNEDPTFSPDGRFIAFMSDRKGKPGIFIMRSTGEDQRRITPRETRAFSPRWSPVY